jgi:hypothetical protein
MVVIDTAGEATNDLRSWRFRLWLGFPLKEFNGNFSVTRFMYLGKGFRFFG